MSETSPLSAPAAPAAHVLVPAHAVSQGKHTSAWSPIVQGIVILTLAFGYWVLLAGESFIGRMHVAPERALSVAGALAALVLAVGSGIAAALARRIAVLELVLGWVVVTAPTVGFLAVALTGSSGLERYVPPDLLYLSTLLGNPISGLLLGAHAVFLLQLLGATVGYLALGGGSLDLRFSFEAHVARQHLRLSGAKVVGVFALGIISPLLLVLWPFTLIGVTLAYAFMSSLTRRRVLEQLMPYIAILGVSIGVCALVTVLSVMSGFEVDLKRKILGTNAHAVVMKYGTDFADYKDVAEKVRAVRGVKGVSPFVLNEVMLTSEQNIAGVLIKGIEPGTVGQVTELPQNINETAKGGQGKLEWLAHPEEIPAIGMGQGGGTMKGVQEEIDRATGNLGAGGPQHPAKTDKPAPPVTNTLPGIVLGTELARTLRVYVGDRVNVVSPLGGELGPQGPMPKSRPFRVAAVFYSGMYEYDSKFAYISIEAAQKFFGLGDSVNGLELRVDDIDNTRIINKQILEKLDGYPYRTKDWGEMNRNLFSALRLEKLAMAIMLTFIVLVACINILSTLVVFALQKAKEVAILKSMGARDTGIMKIFVLEGLIIGCIGTVLGLIQGYGCCQFVEKFGIRLDPQVYYIDKLPVKLDPVQFTVVAVVALVLSYLATIFPALNASRLRPVEGLKTE
jgi:lipoprotein-releasing system permease protein